MQISNREHISNLNRVQGTETVTGLKRFLRRAGGRLEE